MGREGKRKLATFIERVMAKITVFATNALFNCSWGGPLFAVQLDTYYNEPKNNEQTMYNLI